MSQDYDLFDVFLCIFGKSIIEVKCVLLSASFLQVQDIHILGAINFYNLL